MKTLFTSNINWENPPVTNQGFVILVSLVKEKVGFIFGKNRGTWEFPGGHVESTDANWEWAVRREYAEEVWEMVAWSVDYVFSVRNVDTLSGNTSYCHVFLNIASEECKGMTFFKDIPSNTTFPIVLYRRIINECRALRGALDSEEETWDKLSPLNDSQSIFSFSEVHYGPCIVWENTLWLIWDVTGKNVLDIGCWSWHNSIVIAKSGAKVLAVDISEKQLEITRQNAYQQWVTLDCTKWSMDNLNMGLWKFDVIISVFAVQFSRDIQKVIRDSFCLLNNWWSVVFSFPNVTDDFPAKERTMLTRKDWKNDTPSMGMRYYNIDYLVSIFYNCWFSKVEVFSPEYLSDKKNTPYHSKYHDAMLSNLSQPYTVIIKWYKDER